MNSPLACNLSQVNPVHILTPHLFQFHFNMYTYVCVCVRARKYIFRLWLSLACGLIPSGFDRFSHTHVLSLPYIVHVSPILSLPYFVFILPILSIPYIVHVLPILASLTTLISDQS